MSTGRERSGIQSQTGDTLVIRVSIGGNTPIDVVVDPSTLTLMERRRIKIEMAKLGYEPDQTDMLAGSIWVVMQRDDLALTYDEVCESITFGDMQDPTLVEPGDRDESDPN